MDTSDNGDDAVHERARREHAITEGHTAALLEAIVRQRARVHEAERVFAKQEQCAKDAHEAALIKAARAVIPKERWIELQQRTGDESLVKNLAKGNEAYEREAREENDVLRQTLAKLVMTCDAEIAAADAEFWVAQRRLWAERGNDDDRRPPRRAA